MGTGELHYCHADQSDGESSGTANIVTHIRTDSELKQHCYFIDEMSSVLASSWDCVLWQLYCHFN